MHLVKKCPRIDLMEETSPSPIILLHRDTLLCITTHITSSVALRNKIFSNCVTCVPCANSPYRSKEKLHFKEKFSKIKKSLCKKTLPNISSLTSCSASDIHLLLFNFFNLSQSEAPKAEVLPAQMTAQIAAALGRGVSSDGWMELRVGCLQSQKHSPLLREYTAPRLCR